MIENSPKTQNSVTSNASFSKFLGRFWVTNKVGINALTDMVMRLCGYTVVRLYGF